MSEKSIYSYKIYTDGSCKGNGKKGDSKKVGCGGWSYIILRDGDIVAKDCGGEYDTTNNRMEMTAMINACKKVEEISKKYNRPFMFEVYSDSSYIINCCTERWYASWERNGWKNSKKEDVANTDLWAQLIPYFKKKDWVFNYVKGHYKDRYNNMVDEMAQSAAEEMQNK